MSAVRVATSLPSESYHNTIVLGDIEVVLPVELDEEDLIRESVRLRSEDGSYASTLQEGDPGVECEDDHPLSYFHFLNVPPGRYVVVVRSDDRWHMVLRGLDISYDGAFVNGVSWEGSADPGVLGTPDRKDSDELIEFEEPRCGNC